jgi:hypothetical protein
LTTDLEEVKLDAVINHTKLSNNISSNSKVISENTQEINQLKEQLTNVQSERQTLIKEISKQSEIIKQLSSKVDNLQNTQVIMHSAQYSVRSSTSKESLNTQQTTESLDLDKELNTPNKKYNAVNTRPIKSKEKSAKKHVDFKPRLHDGHFGRGTLKFWHADPFFGHGTLNFCRVNAKLRDRGPKILSGPRPPQEVVSARLKMGLRTENLLRARFVSRIAKILCLMYKKNIEGKCA